MILKGIVPKNTFNSTIAVIRVSTMLVVFGSTVWLLKISSVSTPTGSGLEGEKMTNVRYENV